MTKTRRFFKWLLRAALATICVFVAGALVFTLRCSTVRGNFQPSHGQSVRPEDDTFLTYAEWYIVWSYREKAASQQEHLPSTFPFFGAIGQYWSGYCCSYGVVRGRYPFNFGDHLMLAVIGSSFTVEYALKGAYENTIGRFTEWTSGHQPTDEDRYAAGVAKHYGDFVEDRPFYEFPFFPALRGLWKETSLFGPHWFRKWERKAWLSLDYTVEGAYCGIIEKSSHAVYGVEEDVTEALVENAPESVLAGIPAVRIGKPAGATSFLIRMPRYQKFTDTAALLLRANVRFVEIAGNRQIMLTAVMPASWNAQLPSGEVLFSTPILTDPLSNRVAIRVPVADLGAVLAALPVEHIYDY